MSTIIAARFTTFHEAEEAAQRLFSRGFLEEDVTLFYVAPSGQHARLATGGDKHADAGARDASKGAGKGVTIAVLDTGIWTGGGDDFQSRILASIDVVNGGVATAPLHVSIDGKAVSNPSVQSFEQGDIGTDVMVVLDNANSTGNGVLAGLHVTSTVPGMTVVG